MKIPAPELVVNTELGVYAWKVECGDIRVYGNSADEARRLYQQAVEYEKEA